MVQVIFSIDIYLDSVVRLEVVYELKLALGQVPSLSPASGDFYICRTNAHFMANEYRLYSRLYSSCYVKPQLAHLAQ